MYTPRLIAESTSNVALGIEGDNEVETYNPIKESMDETFGEGTYENWGPNVSSFTLVTIGMSEMIQTGNFYSP